MPYFASLRQSLANFIAPAPNVSDQPLPVSSAGSRDIKPRLDRGRISSTNHTKEWLKTPTQERDTKRSNILGAKNSKVVKSTSIQRSSRTPSTTMKASDKPWSMQLLFSILSKKSSALAEDQLEGSTLVQTPLAAQSTHNNAAPNTTLKLVGNASTVIGDDDEGPKELPQNEFKGWTPDEIWLFEKLNMRGFEPLLDWTWALDFPTLIEELFSLDDSKVFIRSVSGNDYYACKALEGLNLLGARVRDRVVRRSPPEDVIRRELEGYYKWSMQDADLTDVEHVPVLTIASAALKEPVAGVVGRLTDRLQEMGRQYRALWIDEHNSDDNVQRYFHELPTLYGIVIKYTVVAFVTFDVCDPYKPVKTLAVFDLQKYGQDVWHGLALSILFVRARDYLLALQAEGELGKRIVRPVYDPDV